MLIYSVLGALGLGARIELIFVLRLFFGYIFLGCFVCVCVYRKRFCMLDTKELSSLHFKQLKPLLKVYEKKDTVRK
jgi:hypothetical protein